MVDQIWDAEAAINLNFTACLCMFILCKESTEHSRAWMMRSWQFQQQHFTIIVDENMVLKVQKILMMRVCMLHSANGAGCAADSLNT